MKQIEHFFWTCPDCGEVEERLDEPAIEIAKYVHHFRHQTDRAVKPELAIVGSSLRHVTAKDRVFLKSCGIQED